MNRTFAVSAIALAITAVVTGCGSDDSGSDDALYPRDYRKTYQEVRTCRFSLEHNSVRMRVLASPDAVVPYDGRTEPFPPGAVVLKEEFDADDTACANTLRRVTVMRKLPVGVAPADLDWEWQEADGNHEATGRPIRGCTSCHTDCSMMGYDGTCTVP